MEFNSNKKYTIKDIAELAGVSKGTVDRVLHKRGKVSQKAFEKVDAILKKIDYQPNPIARNLKNNKLYKISVLLPDPQIDTYWKPAHEGIITATKEFIPFGVKIESFFYHPYSENSFIEKSKVALEAKPDGLLMVPYSQKESLKILEQCNDDNILLASFNNVIDGLHNENFIGQNLFQSGRVAASLIDKVSIKDKNVGIVHVNEEPHMKEKENGFRDYFDAKKIDLNIATINFNAEDIATFKEEVKTLFLAQEQLSAIFVTNSKAHLILDVLSELGKELVVVGYDLLDENIDYINKGKIDFLIHQKPKRQAYLGVYHLAEHFLFGKDIPSQKLLPIDIITTENLEYYLV